jgi:hypothetical protein
MTTIKLKLQVSKGKEMQRVICTLKRGSLEGEGCVDLLSIESLSGARSQERGSFLRKDFVWKVGTRGIWSSVDEHQAFNLTSGTMSFPSAPGGRIERSRFVGVTGGSGDDCVLEWTN